MESNGDPGRTTATEKTRPSVGGLAWLIHPMEPAEFFDAYWEKRPLPIRRKSPRYYRALPGLAQVDGLITTTVRGSVRAQDGRPVPGQDGRLVRTGPDGRLTERPFHLLPDGLPDIHDVYRSYQDGYTVVLNGIHWRSAVLGALCRELEADFQHLVGANLYLTPRDAQGFRPHIDSHDVIIAQIHGSKEWRVAATPSQAFPVPGRPSGPIDAVPDARSHLMEPGDALYIPRGYAHEAATQSSSSLHLTIGVHAFTWADLLTEALDLVVAESPDLRRALPVGHIGNAVETARAASLGQSLAAMTSEPVLRAARMALGAKLLQRHAATAGHFRHLDSIPDLTPDSVVGRGFQGPCRIRSDGERVVADYPGNYLSVPSFLAPALEYAAGTHAFTVGSIPGDLDRKEKIEFVARLIGEGFLRIVSNGEDVRHDRHE